jgi:hypothetical protein
MKEGEGGRMGERGEVTFGHPELVPKLALDFNSHRGEEAGRKREGRG